MRATKLASLLKHETWIGTQVVVELEEETVEEAIEAGLLLRTGPGTGVLTEKCDELLLEQF